MALPPVSKSRSKVVELVMEHFGSIEDPRVARTRLHPLINIFTMGLIGTMAGCNGWDDLAHFAEIRSDWFGQMLEMPHGPPSADTFRRVLCAIPPDAFEEGCRAWMASVRRALRGQVIPVDGKSVRGAIKHGKSTTPLHMVHVLAGEQGLLLAHKACEGAWQEPDVLVELLGSLDIAGGTVTADANNCTAKVTEVVRRQGAHYVLCIKGNRGTLLEHVRACFAPHEANDFQDVRTFITQDEAHGRKEERVIRALPMKDWPNEDFKDVRTAVMVERRRVTATDETFERHHYISSAPPDPRALAHAIRTHWMVENGLHWLLDVGLDEDRRRVRDQHGAANLATLSRIALRFLTAEKTSKRGVAAKRRAAGWDIAYLERVIQAGLETI